MQQCANGKPLPMFPHLWARNGIEMESRRRNSPIFFSISFSISMVATMIDFWWKMSVAEKVTFTKKGNFYKKKGNFYT